MHISIQYFVLSNKVLVELLKTKYIHELAIFKSQICILK